MSVPVHVELKLLCLRFVVFVLTEFELFVNN